MSEVDTLLLDHDTLPDVPVSQDRLPRMRELIEAGNDWATQPDSPERALALKDIGNAMLKLNSADGELPQANS